MYKLIKDPRTNEVCAIAKIGANLSFPLNSDNSDFQEYQRWLAEGNVPTPADTQE